LEFHIRSDDSEPDVQPFRVPIWTRQLALSERIRQAVDIDAIDSKDGLQLYLMLPKGRPKRETRD
jgi:hypothetical protein